MACFWSGIAFNHRSLDYDLCGQSFIIQIIFLFAQPFGKLFVFGIWGIKKENMEKFVHHWVNVCKNLLIKNIMVL